MMHAPADSGDIDTTCVPDVAHPTAPPFPASTPTPARPAGAPAGLPMVCWVPRVEVRDALIDDMALMVYVALAGYARPTAAGGRLVAWVRQDTLANLLGCVEEHTVRRAVAVLRAAGLIRTWRTSQRVAMRYELLVVAGSTVRWDVVPRALVRAVQTRAIPRGVVRTWLHLDQALGAQGRTSDTVAELMARTGRKERTVRRHVHQLAALGLLEVHERPGLGWTLTRPGAPTMPTMTDTPAPAAQTTAEATHLLHSRPGPTAEHGNGYPLSPVDNPGEHPLTPVTDVRSPRSQMSGPVTAPVNPAPENQLQTPSAVLPKDRQFRNARDTVTSGEPKERIGGRLGRAQTSGPSGQVGAAGGRRRAPVARVEARKDVAAVLGALPVQWLSGSARRWRPGIAAAVAVALDAGAPVPAVVRAVAELGDLDGVGGRHVLAVRGALATLSTDLRLGLACTGCGSPLDRPQAPCGPCTGSYDLTGPTVRVSATAAPTSPAGTREAAGPALDVDPRRLDNKPRPAWDRAQAHHGGGDHQDGQDAAGDELPLAVRITTYADLGLTSADVEALGDHPAAQAMTTTTGAAAATSRPAPAA